MKNVRGMRWDKVKGKCPILRFYPTKLTYICLFLLSIGLFVSTAHAHGYCCDVGSKNVSNNIRIGTNQCPEKRNDNVRLPSDQCDTTNDDKQPILLEIEAILFETSCFKKEAKHSRREQIY